jgi:ribosomal-protein-alanine acetyltransferase
MLAQIAVMASLKIVPMSAEDLDEVMKIERLSFPSPWSRAFFSQQQRSRSFENFIARDEDVGREKVLGYICLLPVGGEVHILNVAVHPEFRRKGIATRLIEFSLEHCLAKGVRKAVLEVRRSNHLAQEMYKKLGFKETGVEKAYYSDNWEDAIKMSRELVQRPKFIADAMLGKLARWLRILGYDTIYFTEKADGDLIRIAREEERIILTRDTRLIKRGDLGKFFFIQDNNHWKQLQEACQGLDLKVDPRFFLSRCLICNREIVRVTKKSVRGKVPEYVFKTQEVFFSCPDCQRIYWGATHRTNMLREIGQVLGVKDLS